MFRNKIIRLIRHLINTLLLFLNSYMKSGTTENTDANEAILDFQNRTRPSVPQQWVDLLSSTPNLCWIDSRQYRESSTLDASPDRITNEKRCLPSNYNKKKKGNTAIQNAIDNRPFISQEHMNEIPDMCSIHPFPLEENTFSNVRNVQHTVDQEEHSTDHFSSRKNKSVKSPSITDIQSNERNNYDQVSIFAPIRKRKPPVTTLEKKDEGRTVPFPLISETPEKCPNAEMPIIIEDITFEEEGETGTDIFLEPQGVTNSSTAHFSSASLAESQHVMNCPDILWPDIDYDDCFADLYKNYPLNLTEKTEKLKSEQKGYKWNVLRFY